MSQTTQNPGGTQPTPGGREHAPGRESPLPPESPPQQEPSLPESPSAVRPPRVRTVLAVLRGVITLGVLVAVSYALFSYFRPRPSMWISLGLWAALDLYWSVAERKRPPAKSRETQRSRRLHGILGSLALLFLFLPIPGLTGRFVPDTLTTAFVGLGIQVGFALFYIWCRLILGRLWSGAITIMADHQLIERGPYRILRHPMYTGILGMFMGTAIVSGQYHALIGVAIGTLTYWRKIRLEERVLCDEFGPAYETYRHKTAALIPWLL